MKRMYANLAMELDVAKYNIEKTLKPCDKRAIACQIKQNDPKTSAGRVV